MILLYIRRIYHCRCCTFRGARKEWKDVNSCTPFLVAAANGSLEVVKTLEEENKRNAIQFDKLDKNRKSAVYLAVEGNHVDLLKVCNLDIVGSQICKTNLRIDIPQLPAISLLQ